MKISLLLLKNLIQETEMLKIANAIENAQEIREKSWRMVNDRQGYQISQFKAAQEAVRHHELEPFWAEVIKEWNEEHWNDIQYWARALIEIKEK